MPFDGVKSVPTIPELDKIITYAKNRPENETVLILTEALRLVRKGWGRGAFAKCWLIPVPMNSIFATRYCAKGAIYRAGHNLGFPGIAICRAQDVLKRAIGWEPIIDWNDSQPRWCRGGQRNVIRGFECAIVIAERECAV